MPAPYRDKSILEMSDREREARRQADLLRPGRDAIEGVYPEEVILPATKLLRGLGQAVKTAGKKTARAVDMATRPKVANEVVRPQGSGLLVGRVPARPEDVTHAYRNVSKREIEDIIKSGYARRDPNPDMVKRDWSPDKKWWSAGDEKDIYGRNWNRKDAQKIRTKVENVPSKRAVKRKDLELYNPEKGGYEPLKKGGEVRARKGDGIAQRGKTKGRMI